MKPIIDSDTARRLEFATPGHKPETYANTYEAAHAIAHYFRCEAPKVGRKVASAYCVSYVLIDHDGAGWEMVDNPARNWPTFYKDGARSSAREAFETFLQI